MGKISRFEDMECWKESRKLVNMVYKESLAGSISKDFDFISQIRRASISIMNNIAEGFGRFSKNEFIRFLNISVASIMEVKSMLYLASDFEYLDKKRVVELHFK